MAQKPLDRTLTWKALITAAREGCGILMLGRDRFTLVDESKMEELDQFRWGFHTGGYAVRHNWNGSKNKMEYLHRRIAETPSGLYTDHVSMNKLDNRMCNLRNCTSFQSSGNTKRTKKISAGSDFKGVRKIGKSSWHARAVEFGKEVNLGRYKSEEEAARAYDKWAAVWFGEFARTNFPI